MLLSNAGMPYLVPVIAKLAPLQQSQAVCVILEADVDTLRDWMLFSRIYHMASSPITGWRTRTVGFVIVQEASFSVGKWASPVAARDF